MPRRTPSLEDHSWERVGSREVSRALQVGHPWLLWLALPVLAAILHALWPHWWAAAMIAAGCFLLACGSLYLTHDRKGWHGKLMAPASLAVMGAWLTWMDLAGFHSPRSPQTAVWFIGMGTGAWYWSHWLHHGHLEEAGSFVHQFIKGAATVGHQDVKVLSMEPLDEEDGTGQEGMIKLPAGVTAEEFGKDLRRVESAIGAPVGSLTTTTHLPNARFARLAVSDPLMLEGIQPWPGPSIERGGSIADPVRVGKYANGRPEKYVVVNDHVQVMGKSGSGKSFGFAWNEDAEQFTRYDAAVMAADITKADQTLGPMRQGLHRIETTRDGVAALLEGIHRAVPARTAALTAAGFNRWFKGCPLTHLTVNLEEAPDIVDLLDDADLIREWLSDIKAGRSAGIRWRLSLQRSTFDQLPTIVRAQLSRVCYGLADDGDADYGLSDAQLRAKCHPGDWGHKYPGKHYLDVPGIPDELIAVEARSYGWGDATKDGGVAGAKMMRAHCARYPASARPLDEITLAAMEPPVSPSTAIPLREPADPGGQILREVIARVADGTIAAPPDQVDEAQQIMAANRPHPVHGQPRKDPAMPDPDHDDPNANLDDDLAPAGQMAEPAMADIPPDDDNGPRWVFAGPDEEDTDDPAADSPEVARAKLNAKLDAMRKAGVLTFDTDPFVDVLEDTGRSIAWLYKELKRLTAEGQIRELPTWPKTWRLGRAA